MAKRPARLLIAIPIVLVAVAAALAAYLLFTNQWDGPQTGKRIEMRKAKLKRDYGNGILTVEFSYKNETEMAVTAGPPHVRLVAGEDEQVPLFEPPNQNRGQQGYHVPAGQRRVAMLRFWLDPKHFKGPLFLVSGSDRVMVKSPEPANLEEVTDQNWVRILSVNWDLKNLRSQTSP